MFNDNKELESNLKEALILFEASFVQFTKKPTKDNIDELITSGNSYKELWIMAMSDQSVAGNIEKLNDSLKLSKRNLDYKRLDELSKKLEDLNATYEDQQQTLKDAVKSNEGDFAGIDFDLTQPLEPTMTGSLESREPALIARTHSENNEASITTVVHDIPSMLAATWKSGHGTHFSPEPNTHSDELSEFIDSQRFIHHSLRAKVYNLDKDRYFNRRWYFNNPSMPEIEDMVNHWRNDPKYRELDDNQKKQFESTLTIPWMIKRKEFEGMMLSAFEANHFNYINNDARQLKKYYPQFEVVNSNDLTKEQKLEKLKTFSLPSERLSFEKPQWHYVYQDTYSFKPKGDIAIAPFTIEDTYKLMGFNENKFESPSSEMGFIEKGIPSARVWRDVMIYGPNSITIRSASTNINYKNSTIIPDNSQWIISNDMPSISNQLMREFISQLDPELGKKIREQDHNLAKENFKNA